MFGTHWSWVGHSVVYLILFAVLLIPGVVLFSRWKVGRLPLAIGLVVGWLVIFLPLQLLVGYSIAIRTASWTIRHRLIAIVGVVAVVVAFCVAWFIAERLRIRDAENGVAKAAAGSLGAAGGILLTMVAIVGLTWARRYESPVDVSLAVPAIKLDVHSYVALGDSYSAGEGLAPYLPGAGDDDDRCHRSPDAYSEQLHLTTAKVTPIFRACSGARSGQVFGSPQNDTLGLQVKAGLLSNETKLVTLTMGGNDVHFSEVLTFCAEVVGCLDAPFTPGPAASDEAGLVPAEPLRQWASDMLPVVQKRLEAVFAALRSEAPTARIVVIGYPKLLPTGDVPRQFDSCDFLLRLFDRSEREGISNLQAALNQTIYDAARTAHVEFLDPTSAFASHEACGVKGEMINDVKLAAQVSFADPGTFHPRKEGQLMLARQLSCYLNQYPQPPDDSHSAAPGSSDNPIRC